MLIEFSVSNFKSIAKKVTFSMAASASATKKRGVTHATGNSVVPHVLTSSALFGPNASGKSSFIESLSFMKNFILGSAQNFTHGDPISFPQNKLHLTSPKPSEFEIIFLHENKIFQYGFSANNERVIDEWLFCKDLKPRGKMKTFFQREYNSKKKDYDWDLKSFPEKNDNFKKLTRDNALFLSTAVQLNSKSLVQPFEWVKSNLIIFVPAMKSATGIVAELIKKDDSKKSILDFMESLDIKIEDIWLKDKQSNMSDSFQKMFSARGLEFAKFISASNLFTTHKNIKGENVSLPFSAESDGTQAIFNFAGFIIPMLATGLTIVVDELNNSLHPHALKKIIGMFHNKEKNLYGAQLIFSSHDTYIMSEDLLHKDQIWLVERPKMLATTITPLSDFITRETEAFARSYHRGRFRAIPRIFED